jgi:hypothetical protein
MRRKINHKNIKPLKEVYNYEVIILMYFIIHILYPFMWQSLACHFETTVKLLALIFTAKDIHYIWIGKTKLYQYLSPSKISKIYSSHYLSFLPATPFMLKQISFCTEINGWVIWSAVPLNLNVARALTGNRISIIIIYYQVLEKMFSDR